MFRLLFMEDFMELDSRDKLFRANALITGLRDIMVYLELMPEQEMFPVTILHPFEEILIIIQNLIDEVWRTEEFSNGSEC